MSRSARSFVMIALLFLAAQHSIADTLSAAAGLTGTSSRTIKRSEDQIVRVVKALYWWESTDRPCRSEVEFGAAVGDTEARIKRLNLCRLYQSGSRRGMYFHGNSRLEGISLCTNNRGTRLKGIKLDTSVLITL